MTTLTSAFRQPEAAQLETYHHHLFLWGISRQTAQYFGLDYRGGNWISYPSDEGCRRRLLALDGKNVTGAKNKWDRNTAHLPMPPLFNTKSLDGHSEAILTNGEKSTLALHTAGVPNAVNTFGEGSRVPDAIETLLSHGIRTLYNYPDCDEAGIRAARKWERLGAAAGLRVITYDLQAYMHHQFNWDVAAGYDLRDLWLWLIQDPDTFQHALKNMPRLPFDDPAEDAFSPFSPVYGGEGLGMRGSAVNSPPYCYGEGLGVESNPPPYAWGRGQRSAARDLGAGFSSPPYRYGEGLGVGSYDDWQTLVLQHLETVSPSPRGPHKHRHCPNPAHEDRHPSFRITEQGAPVCTCGQIKWTDLAAWVGAPTWDDFKAERFRQIARDPALRHFPAGLPRPLVEQFFKLHRLGDFDEHTAAALTYHLWHEAILEGAFKPNQLFTLDDLRIFALDRDRDTSMKTLRKGIDQLDALGFMIKAGKLRQPGKGNNPQLYQAQPLHLGLSRLREVLLYRARERRFAAIIPDRVTADWFNDDPQAFTLADFWNAQRGSLYDRHRDAIAQAESALSQQEEADRQRLNLEKLLAAPPVHLPPGQPWPNGRVYRDHYYRQQALFRGRKNRPLTLRQAAAQIGVSSATLKAIRLRTHIATIPQFDEFTIARPYQVLAAVDAGASWAAGRLFGRWLSSSNGAKRRVDPADPAGLDAWTAAQLSSGATVTAQIQTASLERPASPEEVAQFKTRRAEKRASQRIKYRSKISRSSPRALSEVMPPAFTQAYIDAQLKMTPDYENGLLLAEAIQLGATVQLVPESPPIISASRYMGHKTGNNYPPDVEFAQPEDDLFGEKRRE